MSGILAGLEPVPVLTRSVPPAPVEADTAPAELGESGPPLEAAQSQSVVADESNWPSDAAEAAFLSENPLPADASMALAAPQEEEEESPAALPQLGALVEKVPKEVRDVLEDLFRAKWTKVIRVSKKSIA